MRVTEEKHWGEVFRLIEQTLVSEAVESSAGALEPDLVD